MLDTIFRGIFDSDSVSVISLPDFLLCILCALAAGLILALVFSRHSRSTRGYVITLAMLPAAVCVIIMMVNGNVGTGVAVAGAFSLIRFRSAPGTAREIGALFIAMGAGLLAGMGYLAYAILFTLILCAAFLLLERSNLGASDRKNRYKTLRVTIPEDLSYTEVFDDIFKKYTRSCELTQVRTTNMGSLFRLTYEIELADSGAEQQMINELRCRNGNLEISIARSTDQTVEL